MICLTLDFQDFYIGGRRMLRWPAWLKTAWWIAVTITTGFLTVLHFDSLFAEKVPAVSVFLLVVLVALCLVPLASSIELPGLKLKAELKEVKEELSKLSIAVRTNQEVHSVVSPNFTFGGVPSDASLKQIEDRIQSIVKQELARKSSAPTVVIDDIKSVDADTEYLFKVRYNLENTLRFLAQPYFEPSSRFLPINKILELLRTHEIISSQVAGAIKEIYSICSPAVHGEKVSTSQLRFVKGTAPGIMAVLNDSI
jgi:hypothetical protein